MAEQILNNLIEAVNNLRDTRTNGNNTTTYGWELNIQRNSSVRNETSQTTTAVETKAVETMQGAMHRLYPSTSTNQPPAAGNVTRTPDQTCIPNTLTRFNNLTRASKRKLSESSTSTNRPPSKPTLKEINVVQ